MFPVIITLLIIYFGLLIIESLHVQNFHLLNYCRFPSLTRPQKQDFYNFVIIFVMLFQYLFHLLANLPPILSLRLRLRLRL